MNIIAADWGKDVKKRSAYRADLYTRTIHRLPFDGRLAALINYASSLPPPVLVGIDAAIGLPCSLWKSLPEENTTAPIHFIDFLFGKNLPIDFFEPVSTPDDWAPQQPFIRPPPGPWSLKKYIEASNNGIHRTIDIALKANPIFVMSGIPGTVGSGTQTLWKELIAIEDHLTFQVWPFQGPFGSILKTGTPIIAEIYPKACYGIAISDTLPAPLLSIAKTKASARESAIGQMLGSSWIREHKVKINDVVPALLNEDHFDALISAAALLRIFLEGAPVETADTVDAIAEGSVLGAACLNNSKQRLAVPNVSSALKNKDLRKVKKYYRCPIPGCDHVFHNSRGGWDSHIASVRRHTKWHAEINDETERKALFKQEYPDWFLG